MSPGLAAWSLPLGMALDALIGDPRGWPHPVRAIGWLIARAERVLRRLILIAWGGPGLERVAGVLLVVVVVGITTLTAWSLVAICDHLGPIPSLAGRSLLIHFGLAMRSLRDEALRASEAADLPAARRELAMIVGRDTADLDWPEVHRACVETVAENANDGVIAVVLGYAVAGPVGVWAFKAINTLDSMVGYRNESYRDLGWASAKLDDLAGLLPARASGLFLVTAAMIVGEDAIAAMRIGWRDGRNHPSPNSAWSEATMAGALGVQLGGPASYKGVPGFKPRLGDPGRPIDAGTVRRSIRMMVVASVLAGLVAWLVRVSCMGLA